MLLWIWHLPRTHNVCEELQTELILNTPDVDGTWNIWQQNTWTFSIQGECCNSTDCSKYMFVLYHNCSAFKSNSTTISTWLFFIHLNSPHFTECFIGEVLPLCLYGFKANVPQISPRLLQLQVLPGNPTALTVQSEARKPSQREGTFVPPPISLYIQSTGHIPKPFFHL